MHQCTSSPSLGPAPGGLGLLGVGGALGSGCCRGGLLSGLCGPCGRRGLLSRDVGLLSGRGPLGRVRSRGRRGVLVVQHGPKLRRVEAAMEQGGRGGEDVLCSQAEALCAAVDRAQGLTLVGGVVRRVIERRQDGGKLLLAELGGTGHGMISALGEHERSPTSPSPGGWTPHKAWAGDRAPIGRARPRGTRCR